MLSYSIRRSRSVEGIYGERSLIVFIATLSSNGILTHLANVLGLGGANAFSLYLATLLICIGTSGLLFLSVASSVRRAELLPIWRRKWALRASHGGAVARS